MLSVLIKYVGSPIAFTTYGDVNLTFPYSIISPSFKVTISARFIILLSFIDIASAPAYLNSLSNKIKSSAIYVYSASSVSVSVITTPLPFTSVSPKIVLACSTSWSSNSVVS